MLRILQARWRQKYRTIKFPGDKISLPEKFCGAPLIDAQKCSACRKCLDVCPVEALDLAEKKPCLDLGRCIFCGACAQACGMGAITFSRDHRLAVRDKNDLVLSSGGIKLAAALKKESLRLFGRSLRLRQVSAGGCNACELDTNVLSTIVFDLARFGVQFVASPRHADGLLITGPVTENMRLALQKTYQAVASPKIVLALGACACSGGLYRGHPQVHNGASFQVPVDLYIPGCPPHPLTILDGILRLLNRV